MEKTGYSKSDLEWLQTALKTLFQNKLASPGLQLQIVDIYVPELNKSNDEVSMETLAAFLEPFLTALATTGNTSIIERIEDSIFSPLLESNAT